MVAHFPAGVSRRLGPTGTRMLQIATHWAAYVRYLEAVEHDLGSVTLPGLGETRLADLFVPVRLRPWPDGGSDDDGAASPGTLVSLGAALEAHPHVHLVGPAGTGKSALLRWHAIESARAVRLGGRLAILADSGPRRLPVYVPMAAAPASTSLEALAASQIGACGLDRAEEFLGAHLESGRALLLFDDLDTLPVHARQSATERISDLVARFPANQVVVATRDPADRTWLPGFRVMDVVGIDPNQVETLAKRWGYEQVANASGFLQLVERSPLVRSLVSRPGWLAAALGSMRGVAGPVRAFDIVERFVQHLEPSVDGAWSALARVLHERRTAVGHRADLPSDRLSSGLLQWLSDDEFRFVHAAVQAYFAARALDGDEPALAARAGDEWWDPVIVLAAGLLPDPSPLVELLLTAGHKMLAALALAEVRSPQPELVETVQLALLSDIGQAADHAERSAAIALAGLQRGESVGRTGVVAPVLSALDGGPPVVRRAAAAALGRLGDPSAIPALLAALGDGDDAVRDTASDSLAVFGDRTVQPLVRQLNVPNERIRQAAIVALARQGGHAVPALVPLLDSPGGTGRSEAAETLSKIGYPAVPALLRALTSAAPGAGTSGLVEGAADALTRIGRPAVQDLVSLFAKAGPADARRIAEILHAMGTEAVEALAEIVDKPNHPYSATAAALVGELPTAGIRAAASLVRALADGRFEVRAEARRSLRRLGMGVTESLLDTLQHPDLFLRWEAAQILLALPEPPVQPLTVALTEMLRASDVTYRRRAIRALGALTGPGVRSALIKAMKDQDVGARQMAIAQLGVLGDPAAVSALQQRWKRETDPECQIALLHALVDLAKLAAVPTLIDGMARKNDDVRRVSSELLATCGEEVVDPLVSALNSRPAEIDLKGTLYVLERSGSGARAGGGTPANLARVYYRMLVEPLDVDELVYLSTTIEWWPHAFELHRTFDFARHALDYKSLAGIASAKSELDWLDDIRDWLQPTAGKVLRQLGLIADTIQYHTRGGKRAAKEKGLGSATAHLASLRPMITELGEPHRRVFHQVEEHWSTLVSDAFRELQGRSDLDVELRTDRVRIRDTETAAVLVFELVNRGEGLASNIQLALSVDAGDLALMSAPTYFFPPLGQSDQIAAEFTVRRQGAGVVPVAVEVRYDDPQTQGQTKRFAREVRFFVEDAEYRDIGSSPYIAGPPVKTPQMFYGRQSTFAWVQENLSGTFQDNVLVLHGERRTGKTSVLYQLPYHLPPNYAVVLIDLQSIAYGLVSDSELLYAMARKVAAGLARQGIDLPRPDRESYARHPIEQFEELGERIGTMAVESDRRVVLIVDEFDLLIEAEERGDVSRFVFDCVRGLMQHQVGLSFIFAGAHKISAMLKNPQSILFNTALTHRVSFLDRDNAERLIREPVADVLWYDDLAVEKILRVTAGQPYFIQYICHEIVNLARRDMRNFATLRDVDRALQSTVEETTGIIRHSFTSLTLHERAALTAVGHITDDGRPFASLDDIDETLHQDGASIVRRDLFDALRSLVERDFLLERGGEGIGRQYGFSMELVRVWIEQNDEYPRLLEELRG